MDKIEIFETREDAFQIILIKLVEKQIFLVFLLDPWKTGYQDFEQFSGTMKQLKQEIGLPTVKFHKISKKKGAQQLRQAYDIANEVGIEIDEKAKNWMERLGVNKISHEGTLYKCFNCLEGDLLEQEISEIIEIARKDIRDGNVGTEEEEQYFYICQSCKDEMHEQHKT